MREHCSKTSARFLIWSRFRVDDWWTRAILSNPETVARGICGEKGDAGIECSPDLSGVSPSDEWHKREGEKMPDIARGL